MSNPRYFEFVGGGSNKFWSVAWQGSQVTVRFGRIGTEGQVKARQHGTAGAAKAEVESLVAAKLAKGYREKKAPANGAAKPAARKPAAGGGATGGFAALERELVPETSFSARDRVKLAPGWQKEIVKAAGMARLPPSYLDFVDRLRTVGEWIRRGQQRVPRHLEVYVNAKWFRKARKLHGTVLDIAARFDQADEAAKWRGLVVFGTDSAGGHFCWDPARTDKRGEPPILVVDNNAGLKVTTVAKDLYDLMRSYRQKRGDDEDDA